MSFLSRRAYWASVVIVLLTAVAVGFGLATTARALIGQWAPALTPVYFATGYLIACVWTGWLHRRLTGAWPPFRFYRDGFLATLRLLRSPGRATQPNDDRGISGNREDLDG